MSGLVIAGTPKRLVDFAGVASGSTLDFILADRVPIVPWRELSMLVHIYSHGIASGAGTITIMAAPQSWTQEDPSLQFLTFPSAGWTQIVLNNNTQNPGYLIQPFVGGGTVNCTSGMTRLIARGNRTAAGGLNANISVEISAKDA